MEKVPSVENDVDAVVDEKGSHLRSIFANAVDSNSRGDAVTQTSNGTMGKHDLKTMNDVRGESETTVFHDWRFERTIPDAVSFGGTRRATKKRVPILGQSSCSSFFC